MWKPTYSNILLPEKMSESVFEERKSEYEHIREVYWHKHSELEEIKRLMNRAQADMQQACTHVWVKDWEERGRSRWYCQHCGVLR